MALKKLKKFPKQPKAGASTATWEAYKRRCQEINKENKKIVAEQRKHDSVVKSAKSIKKVTYKK